MLLPEKILIDTNIIINLEDNREVQEKYSKLNRLCGENGIKIYIHESSYNDIKQDKDIFRQQVSLSKLEKYPCINKTPTTKEFKEKQFGRITSRNDDVDTDLLVSLSNEIVDLIVTEDKGLITRIQNAPNLSNKVLDVTSTLQLIISHYGNVLVDYKHIHELSCEQLNYNSPFFESLKHDYGAEEFVNWFKKCMRERRKCWVIKNNLDISGLIIRHNENNTTELSNLLIPGNKVMKICLFKTDSSIKGEKYGEQLLKAALDFAYKNNFDSTFLTVLPKQKGLINLISKFGFLKAKNKGSEFTYYKYTKVNRSFNSLPPLTFHKHFWPCIKKSNADCFLIPIQPAFHERLFPEAHIKSERQMSFEFGASGGTSKPGNAIRKIYICNSPIRNIKTGSILLFYRSRESLITSIGVLEDYIIAKDHEHLINIASGRSVYSHNEIYEKTRHKTPAKAINFYFAKDLDSQISLEDLLKKKLLNGAPQSITHLNSTTFDKICELLMCDDDKGIFYV